MADKRNGEMNADEIVKTLNEMFNKVCDNCDGDIVDNCDECIFLTALNSSCKAVRECYAEE